MAAAYSSEERDPSEQKIHQEKDLASVLIHNPIWALPAIFRTSSDHPVPQRQQTQQRSCKEWRRIMGKSGVPNPDSRKRRQHVPAGAAGTGATTFTAPCQVTSHHVEACRHARIEIGYPIAAASSAAAPQLLQLQQYMAPAWASKLALVRSLAAQHGSDAQHSTCN